jgi:hypothetical protein
VLTLCRPVEKTKNKKGFFPMRTPWLLCAFLLLAAPALGLEHFRNSDAPALPPLKPQPMTPARQKMDADARKELNRELAVLGIKALRPPHDPRNPGAANPPNYDEALANKDVPPPDVLRMHNGRMVTTAAQWWKTRRPEIVEDISREIYGRVPAHVPAVTWKVVGTKNENFGRTPAETRHIVGHVDNSAWPAVSVDIDVYESVPLHRIHDKIPAILTIIFAGAGYESGGSNSNKPDGSGAPVGVDYREQILSKGWAVVTMNPQSIQLDQGGGGTLDKGIIGLSNKGKPRKMDDWGAERAWAWGAARVMDYLQTDARLNGDQIAVAGHSRYGKAALLTMAFDQRFAAGYISASGSGGAKLLRRNFGETPEDLASPAEFHWMAGNFLKYAGPLKAKDLPVDADSVIALAAPRPVFLGSGATNAGDAWVDPKGMFQAAVNASAVWKLLGKKGLETDRMPPVNTALSKGDVAWRQHPYGHSIRPDWPAFVAFASKYLHPIPNPN